MAVRDSTHWVASLKGLSVGAASDTFVPIPSGQKAVIFRRVTTTNASATCASSTATIGVNTKAAAAGTAIVTAATGTHTSLTAASKFTDCTVALSADSATLSVADAPTTYNGAPNGEAGVYVRVAGTPNVTATLDVYIECQFLDA